MSVMENSIKLAITGTIGSGKSVVSRILSIMGVPVYDCDSRAKEMMAGDPRIVAELKRMFGSDCYNDDGTLNKKYIASCIFTDSDNIKRVNALVHPAVCKDFTRWAKLQKSSVVGVETAILHESGMISFVDKTLVVWADKETAIQRTMLRSGMSRRQVESRMLKQMSADELLLLSDFSIYNDKNSPLLPAVTELLAELRGLS